MTIKEQAMKNIKLNSSFPYAEQIANLTKNKTGIANHKAINTLYRSIDASKLWPVRGRFNITERAIRKARKFQQQSGCVYGLEYCYLLEEIMSKIVNNSKYQ